MTSSVAIAAKSTPEIFVSSIMPPVPRKRESSKAKRIDSQITTWVATTAPTTPTMEPTVWACAIDTITATIAPGPASSGIPSGTKATFTASSPVSGCSMSLEVNSSIATKNNSTPPESFKDSIEIWSARKICCPRKAKARMTPKDTSDAWKAALR